MARKPRPSKAAKGKDGSAKGEGTTVQVGRGRTQPRSQPGETMLEASDERGSLGMDGEEVEDTYDVSGIMAREEKGIEREREKGKKRKREAKTKDAAVTHPPASKPKPKLIAKEDNKTANTKPKPANKPKKAHSKARNNGKTSTQDTPQPTNEQTPAHPRTAVRIEVPEPWLLLPPSVREILFDKFAGGKEEGLGEKVVRIEVGRNAKIGSVVDRLKILLGYHDEVGKIGGKGRAGGEEKGGAGGGEDGADTGGSGEGGGDGEDGKHEHKSTPSTNKDSDTHPLPSKETRVEESDGIPTTHIHTHPRQPNEHQTGPTSPRLQAQSPSPQPQPSITPIIHTKTLPGKEHEIIAVTALGGATGKLVSIIEIVKRVVSAPHTSKEVAEGEGVEGLKADGDEEGVREEEGRVWWMYTTLGSINAFTPESDNGGGGGGEKHDNSDRGSEENTAQEGDADHAQHLDGEQELDIEHARKEGKKEAGNGKLVPVLTVWLSQTRILEFGRVFTEASVKVVGGHSREEVDVDGG